MQDNSRLHRLRDEPKAPGSQPHLLQQGPSCPQPSILIAEGQELKAPEEIWPNLAESTDNKSKDKPSIILTLCTRTGQKGWRNGCF